MCALSPSLTHDNHNSTVLLYTSIPKIQLVAHGTHTHTHTHTLSLSVIKTSQLMLYREINGVCSEIHT